MKTTKSGDESHSTMTMAEPLTTMMHNFSLKNNFPNVLLLKKKRFMFKMQLRDLSLSIFFII